MNKLKREDFHVRINAEGYTIFYKDKSIGGVGIFGKFEGRGTSRRKQCLEYSYQSEKEIMKLIEGTGAERYYKQINNINERKY